MLARARIAPEGHAAGRRGGRRGCSDTTLKVRRCYSDAVIGVNTPFQPHFIPPFHPHYIATAKPESHDTRLYVREICIPRIHRPNAPLTGGVARKQHFGRHGLVVFTHEPRSRIPNFIR